MLVRRLLLLLLLLLLLVVVVAALVSQGIAAPDRSTIAAEIPQASPGSDTTPRSVLGDTSPQTRLVKDRRRVELGMRFTPDVDGVVTALRFYKGGKEAGSGQVGRVWTRGGKQLARVKFRGQSTAGWQVAPLKHPVSLKAGEGYVVSYRAPAGRYSLTGGGFSRASSTSWADIPADAGVYRYGRAHKVPRRTYESSNYFVDILFQPASVVLDGQPEVPLDQDQAAVELGTKFTPRVDGVVTALRFYKGGPEVGARHEGRLWADDGTILADITFRGETDSGWQIARLPSPVMVRAGRSYAVSYHAPLGRYAVSKDAFARPVDGVLVDLPADAGVYQYGTTRGLPTSTYESANYFVDVLFAPTPGEGGSVDSPPPGPEPGQPAGTPSPSEPQVDPGIYVSGNRLVDGSGNIVVLRGVNRSGTEYACIDGWGFFDGPADEASIEAMKAWGINSVRVPLNSACWLDLPHQFATYNAAYAGLKYRDAVEGYVDLLTRKGLYVVLDLHWSGCGDGPCLANSLKPMPERKHATTLWRSVAERFKDNKSVLFDLFNEPHGIDWACWQSGGCTAHEGDPDLEFTTEGMQQMVAAVREGGASTQPILLGGLGYSNDLRGWRDHVPEDPSNALAASVHLYNFSYPCPLMVDDTRSAESAITCFADADRNPIDALALEYPVVFGELGQDDCRSDFVIPMLTWMRERGFGSLAWAWNTGDCARFPALITDYDGTPTAFGEGIRDFYLSNDGPALMQVISAGKPAFASSGIASRANDDNYDVAWNPDGDGWLAFDLSSVPGERRRKAVLAWFTTPDDGYTTGDLQGVCAAWPGRQYLGDYVVELNDGAGGGTPPASGWSVSTTVTGNSRLARQHVIDLAGHNWIRIRGSGPNGININVEVADAGMGTTDGWLFMGDSITARYAGHGSATDPEGSLVRSFTELVMDGTGGRNRPVSENGGTDCAKAFDALAWIDIVLDDFPGKYVTLNFGTNDGWGGYVDPDGYYWAMESLIDKVTERSKIPVIATIPWPNNEGDWEVGIEVLNDQIRRLYKEHPEVVRGPDLYSVTKDRPELFGGPGDVHPNGEGVAVMMKAWAESALNNVYQVEAGNS